MSIYLENHEEPSANELREALRSYQRACRELADRNRLLEEELDACREELEGLKAEVWGPQ